MSALALVGGIYCLVSALHSNLWLPMPVSVSDSTIGHRVGEDLLLQDHFFGPVSSVWLPTQGWRLQVMSGCPQGLCVVGVLRLGPWVSAGSQQPAEGVGNRAHCQRVGPFPPSRLKCHDFADLFHCAEWSPALPMPRVTPKSRLVKGEHEWWDLLHTLPYRQISGSRKQSGCWTKSLIKQCVGLCRYLIVISIALARKRTVTYLQKIHCIFFFCLDSRGVFAVNSMLLPVLNKRIYG